MRSRISVAAALVNVTTNSLSTSTASAGSSSRWVMRSTNTAVFPAPAPAETKRLTSRAVTASLCASVHLATQATPLLRQTTPHFLRVVFL